MDNAGYQIWIFVLGFLAQALFGLRVLLQWWYSEKRREVVSPDIYWYASLFGSVLFIVYGVLRQDAVIVVGQIFSYAIYIRNLQLKGAWSKTPSTFRYAAIVFPFVMLAIMIINMKHAIPVDTTVRSRQLFILLGWAGQFLLTFRFAVQLYYSEKKNNSVLPYPFWIISTSGSCLLLVYAWFRSDPVLFLAQALSLLVSLRNMNLLRKSKST